MPALPITAERSFGVGMTFMDYAGARRSTNIKVRDTGTVADYDPLIAAGAAIAGALGNSSNAAVISVRFQIELSVQPPCDGVEVFDEAFNSVGVVAPLVWRDGLGQPIYLHLPAPDASKFNSDRRSLNTGDAQIAAVLTNMDTLLAATLTPNFDPCYVRSYLNYNAQRFPKFPALPAIVEPGVASAPPQAPALEPA